MNIIITYKKYQLASLLIDRPIKEDCLEIIEVDDSKKKIVLNPIVANTLIQLLINNAFFQTQFLKNNPYNVLKIELSQPIENDIDYKSCNMAFLKVKL